MIRYNQQLMILLKKSFRNFITYLVSRLLYKWSIDVFADIFVDRFPVFQGQKTNSTLFLSKPFQRAFRLLS